MAGRWGAGVLLGTPASRVGHIQSLATPDFANTGPVRQGAPPIGCVSTRSHMDQRRWARGEPVTSNTGCGGWQNCVKVQIHGGVLGAACGPATDGPAVTICTEPHFALLCAVGRGRAHSPVHRAQCTGPAMLPLRPNPGNGSSRHDPSGATAHATVPQTDGTRTAPVPPLASLGRTGRVGRATVPERHGRPALLLPQIRCTGHWQTMNSETCCNDGGALGCWRPAGNTGVTGGAHSVPGLPMPSNAPGANHRQ
jgi:hypothetical protein